ncbi:hypothetical protein [uncultured Alsobacter sp.]|uniref:hypothetical protein n=1 Tax=uncultured Alsobacter sp. TaxID=1748258 RepID=UPI0025CD2412|nr:hypothetical protein [uncultured Alsobacter sp.]
MNTNRIGKIAVRAIEKQSMTNEDVRELKGCLVDDDFISREEAEDLLRIERLVPRTVWSWSEFFIETVTAHLVWERRPTGRILQDDAEWLLGMLDLPRAASAPNLRILLFSLVSEAEEVDQRLIARAMYENTLAREAGDLGTGYPRAA